MRTYREGVAQKVGHDLIIDVEQWEATAEVGEDGTLSAVQLNAISEPAPSQPAAVAGSQPDASDGFDWFSAAVGAFAAIAVVGLSGAAFVMFRRRVAMSASPASTS